jgi:hypothetical protein
MKPQTAIRITLDRFTAQRSLKIKETTWDVYWEDNLWNLRIE